MLPANLSIEIHEGRICIGYETTDYNRPEWIKLFWPTKVSARDFLNFYGCTAEDLPKFSVKQTMPGEYRVEHWDHWHNGAHVSLVNGSRTESVHMVKRPYEIKTRCKKEYSAGRWHVCRAGRWQAV